MNGSPAGRARWYHAALIVCLGVTLLAALRLCHVHLLWADEDYHLAAAQDRAQPAPKQARPAQASQGQVQQAQQFPPEAMDELLGQWELQSRKLQTLEVDIYRVDRDAGWGDEIHFNGHAAFQNPDLAGWPIFRRSR